MKKSLIALAVLAASGTAMAQSYVTLYGVLDIGFGKVKDGKWGLNNGEGYSAGQDGFNSTSVIGFRGSEDLGGGLKANFNLQSGGLDLSTGATSVAFSREAWVGLEGAGWGAIQLGRSSSIGAKVLGAYDFNGTSYSSAYDRAGISAVTWYGSSRRSNQVQYASPNLGGVVVRAGFTPKGDEGGVQGVGVPGTAKNRYSLGATFANGPLSVSAIAETKQAEGLRTAYAVGASYDLQVVKLAATYNRRESEGVDGYNTFTSTGGQFSGGKGWTLAAVAPFGAANVGVQYARNTDADIKALELFANYALSKRTRLYVDFVKGYDQNAVIAVPGGRTAAASNPYAVGLGVVHTF
ncbi:porin [Pseudorhodoferax sp.]|uniref:porin n=1 Tax=Pseudorhodoferax sp. TaxID=1993553 RepID=UPI002DD65E52|nr:porin [Pseudorhodoferax sp.]